MEVNPYENYPAKIVLLSSGITIAIYALGTYILGKLWLPLAILYLLYCLWIEITVLRKSCVHCYYYGKVCGLGKGKLCARLFKRGDPQQFIERETSWHEILPDMLVLAFPVIGGIVHLIQTFSWTVLGLMLLLIVLSLGGSAVVRGSFACKYCKQRELGCPAEKLFSQ